MVRWRTLVHDISLKQLKSATTQTIENPHTVIRMSGILDPLALDLWIVENYHLQK